MSTQTRFDRVAEGDAVSLARAMVRIPSVNPAMEPGGTAEAEVSHKVGEWLRGWGFETSLPEVAPGRFNVLARHPPENAHAQGPTLLFN